MIVRKYYVICQCGDTMSYSTVTDADSRTWKGKKVKYCTIFAKALKLQIRHSKKISHFWIWIIIIIIIIIIVIVILILFLFLFLLFIFCFYFILFFFRKCMVTVDNHNWVLITRDIFLNLTVLLSLFSIQWS